MNFEEGEVLCFDKPLRWTSFDVVNKVRNLMRYRLGIRKVKIGHAGTLDPLATGVLIVCTGKQTKQIESLQYKTKEYVATIRLGATTPSFDLETQIDAEYPISHIDEEMVRETLKKFVGEIQQIPPTYSAVKVNGKRAYDYARRGVDVEIKPKTLVIDEIELLDYNTDEIVVRVVCSKGTYIRALARDIGEALQSGAHLTALRRTRIGDVKVEECYTLENFESMIDVLSAERLKEETEMHTDVQCQTSKEA